jgi:hypothetical protein
MSYYDNVVSLKAWLNLDPRKELEASSKGKIL